MDIDKIKLTKKQAEEMDRFYNEAKDKGYVHNLDGAFGFKMGYMIAFSLFGITKQIKK